MDKSEVLSLAIEREIAAQQIYETAADRIQEPAGKVLLTELAGQEAEHRAMLESVPPDQAEQFQPDETQDRQIGEYLEPTPLAPDSSLQDVLIYAIKREDDARHFYQTMAKMVEGGDLRELLQKLATMETSHKARLEEFYEDVFLKEM